MRIAGGVHKGFRLKAPKGADIRPTSARAREAIFNILGHGIDDFSVEGARVLDLFAGTGALGLEALSRGARFCLFVDTDIRARALIRDNIENLNLTGHSKIYRRDATRLGPARPLKPFGLVFADPPYGKGLGERALQSASEGGWLGARCVIVLEERAGLKIDLGSDFDVLDNRRHGDTQTIIVRAVA